MHHNHYARLGVMAILSFIAMYILMYAMVDEFSSVYPNLNQAYMAALMTAPMVIIEIAVMSGMYKSTALNIAIVAASLVLGIGAFAFIRQQTAVGDVQFLKSMIPHHSGAVLMCREASITDEQINKLCSNIVESQLAEIAEMKTRLAELGK